MILFSLIAELRIQEFLYVRVRAELFFMQSYYKIEKLWTVII